MLLRINGNQLFQLLQTPNNIISVLQIGLEVIPLVGVGGIDEFFSLVSEFKVNLYFFSEQGPKFSGLGFGDFDFMELNVELLFGSDWSFLLEM